MAEVIKSYQAGGTDLSQLEDGSVILWNSHGDAVHIEREDLAAVAREFAAAHVHAGRIKLDAK